MAKKVSTDEAINALKVCINTLEAKDWAGQKVGTSQFNVSLFGIYKYLLRCNHLMAGRSTVQVLINLSVDENDITTSLLQR